MNHDPISRATPIGQTAERRTGTGSLLRASRLRCGEKLDVVVQVLRIRRRHLQAIEDGHFEELPGTTYAVGFIRAYADYLGLDSDEVVRRFKEENTLQPGRPPKADLVFPSPMSESGIPRGALVFLGVLIGVIAYGGWYSSTVDNDFFKNWIEPVPQRLAALVSGGGDANVPDRSQAIAADKPAPTAETTETAPEPGPETARSPMSATTETPATDMTVAETPAAVTSAEGTATASGEPTPATGAMFETGAAPKAADVTPAPEPVTTPVTTPGSETTSVESSEPGAVRPPQSIAQPVETAELPDPLPVAEAAATASAETPAAATEMSSSTVSEPAATETSSGATAPGEATTLAAEPSATEVASAPAIPEGMRIILTAVSDSWVEVREKITDAWVWGKLLRAGEVYPVPDRLDLKMKTGNAGGLTISVDGTDVPPVGDSGEVVRNVLLDPELLKSGTAVSR